MKALYSVLTIVLLTTPALAEGPKHRGGPPLDIDELATRLQLDDTQKTAMQDLLEQQRADAELRREQFDAAGTRPSREEVQDHRAQAREEMLVQLQSILTDAQLEEFQALMEERPRRHRPQRDELPSDEQ